jgi:ferritin-like metal-binding protein YciE
MDNWNARSIGELLLNKSKEKHSMPQDTIAAPTTFEAAAHETLVASLRNTHALEKQQITVLNAQLDLFEELPDLHARVTEHIVETRDQARRLEAGLEACGSSSSMVKDTLLSVMGLGQSSVQGLGNDAVLKAVTADIMEEHLEIATYRTLLALADMAGKPELRARLEETLQEEEAMAAWFDENLETITRRVVEIKASERQTDTAPPDEAATADGDEPQTLWQTLENAETPHERSRSAAESNPGTAKDDASENREKQTARRTDEKASSSGGTRAGD